MITTKASQFSRRLAYLSGLAGLMLSATALAAPAAAPAAASGTAAPAATAPAVPTAQSMKPTLPLEFSDFATDYQITTISPPWLAVQVGTIETYYAPPSNMASFILGPQDFRRDLAANYNPIEFSCLMGTKSRYENVTLISVDKAGHPLGYTLSFGKVIYFLARGDTPRGIAYSIHYYDSGKDLDWVPNQEKNGYYIPVIHSISVTQNYAAPADNYVFQYLSSRVGTATDKTYAKPMTLYTYLVIHVTPLVPPQSAAATGIVPGS